MSQQETKSNLEALSAALEVGELQQLRFMLNKGLKPVEVAHLLEKTPPRERQILWNLLNQELEGEVLQYLGDDAQTEILSRMEASEVLAITESLETDDMADILQQLPERVMKELLQIMDQQNRERVEEVLAYPEDTAGGLMNTDTVTIRPDINVETVLRYLRRHKDIPEMTDTLFVVSRKDSYIGVLPLTRLLTADPGVLVREIMQTDVEPIPADMPDESVARLFEQLDLISAPVVNEEGRLLGRITIDDVVDVIREDADHSLMSMAGLDDDEDTFAPIMKTTRRRAVWLGINLITAFAASAVIGLFEATIDKVVADADCCLYGGHRRQPDTDTGDPRSGPGAYRALQYRLAVQPRAGGRAVERDALGIGRCRSGCTLVSGHDGWYRDRHGIGNQPDCRRHGRHPAANDIKINGYRPCAGRRRPADNHH
jgi:magnesium transporter